MSQVQVKLLSLLQFRQRRKSAVVKRGKAPVELPDVESRDKDDDESDYDDSDVRGCDDEEMLVSVRCPV